MGRWLRANTVLLTAVVTALLLRGTAGTILTCYCSDCAQDQPFCHGEVCTKEAYLDQETGEKISERWRCSNSSLTLCNISSPILTYDCCDSHDFCNYENYTAEIQEKENRTDELKCHSSNMTANYSNMSLENSTINCNDTETSSTSDIVYPSSVPEDSLFQCYEAESSYPRTFNFSFCETTTSCFNLMRVRSDGSRVFRWGCTREGPSQSCVEEDRNRKKKSCCRGWFCNQNISSDWLKGYHEENETTPTRTPPTPDNTTRPPPPDLSMGVVPTEEETNCNVTEGGASSDIKPCVGPGSVGIELTPDVVDPIATQLPGGMHWKFLCYCTTCEDSLLCGSNFGCATSYSYEFRGGRLKIIPRHFCMDEQYFSTCGTVQGHVCCLSNLCNRLHQVTDTEAPPTNNDTTTTEPITSASTVHITTATMATTATMETTASMMDSSAPDQNTVNPSSPPPASVNSSETELATPSGNEDLSLLLYTMCAVLALLLSSLAVVMVVLTFCCYGYRKRRRAKHPLSPRQQITMVTRQRTTQPTAGSKFTRPSPEEGVAMATLTAVKMVESSKVEHSCATDSTYTQPSSPESTV